MSTNNNLQTKNKQQRRFKFVTQEVTKDTVKRIFSLESIDKSIEQKGVKCFL